MYWILAPTLSKYILGGGETCTMRAVTPFAPLEAYTNTDTPFTRTQIVQLSPPRAGQRMPVTMLLVFLAAGASAALPYETWAEGDPRDPLGRLTAMEIRGLCGTRVAIDAATGAPREHLRFDPSLYTEGRHGEIAVARPTQGLGTMPSPDGPFPRDFDARTVRPECRHAVRNQFHCGSCWAFSVAETWADNACWNGTGASIPNSGPADTYSVEHILACDHFGPNKDCSGGIPGYAWDMLKDSGIVSEKCFPYTSKNMTVASCPPEVGPDTSVCPGGSKIPWALSHCLEEPALLSNRYVHWKVCVCVCVVCYVACVLRAALCTLRSAPPRRDSARHHAHTRALTDTLHHSNLFISGTTIRRG